MWEILDGPLVADGCLWGLVPQSRHWSISLILPMTAIWKQRE
jgi:hypothetical protein